MQIGFEIDSVKFSLTSLDDLPSHATALARIFTSFSLIEGAVGGVYGLLKHQEYNSAVEELKALGTNVKRVAAVRKIIKERLPVGERAVLDDVMRRVLLHAEKRNKVAHGIWGTHPNNDTLYRLPVRQWITFLASMIPNAGDAGDIIDDLNEHMEEWSMEDFINLEREGADLLRDILMIFNYHGLEALKK